MTWEWMVMVGLMILTRDEVASLGVSLQLQQDIPVGSQSYSRSEFVWGVPMVVQEPSRSAQLRLQALGA